MEGDKNECKILHFFFYELEHSSYWSNQTYLGWHLDDSVTLSTCGSLAADLESEQLVQDLAVEIINDAIVEEESIATTNEPDVSADAVTEITNGNVT